jgi:hypothetical protein
MENTYIKIGATDRRWIEEKFLEHVGDGFYLERAWVSKKYWLFGTKKYWIMMKPNDRYYQNEIAEAVGNQDYEKAKELKEKLEAMKKISFQ